MFLPSVRLRIRGDRHRLLRLIRPLRSPLWGLLVLWVAACAPQAPSPVTPLPDLAAFRPFVVPRPLAPFEAQGAAVFTYRDERESGDLRVQALPGPAFRLELRSPLTGGVALEVWLAALRLRVIDYVNETYLFAANTPEVRRRLFAVDLAPADLQTLLTGRVDRARFAAGGGVISPSGEEAAFRENGALQRFRLGAQGLPSEWVKETPAGRAFRVEFREYLALELPGGAPLRLPRKVRVHGPADETLLVLGLHTVTPGAGGKLPDLDRLPPAAQGFAPGELPAR